MHIFTQRTKLKRRKVQAGKDSDVSTREGASRSPSLTGVSLDFRTRIPIDPPVSRQGNMLGRDYVMERLGSNELTISLGAVIFGSVCSQYTVCSWTFSERRVRRAMVDTVDMKSTAGKRTCYDASIYKCSIYITLPTHVNPSKNENRRSSNRLIA